MKNKGILSALGGDIRQLYISELFEKDGYEIRRFGIVGCEDSCEDLHGLLYGADMLLLPIPMTRDGYLLNCREEIPISYLAEQIPDGCTVFAGKIPPAIKDFFSAAKIRYYDYFDDKTYIWQNAEITAEGALFRLMNELDTTLKEAKILICGYGRIAKCLSKKLSALGASVTVAARKQEDLMLAETWGDLDTDKLDYRRDGLFDICRSYDAIINTVPSWIFDASNSALLEKTVYFELASSPYGGEIEFMKRSCRKYILASGIPGIYAPKSAARAVYLSLSKIYRREENT